MDMRQHERLGVRPISFDVTEWLAGLNGCPRDQIAYLAKAAQGGRLFVTYRCGAVEAKVRLGSLPSANWELVAQMGDRIERIVVPGSTRFGWR